VPFSCCDALAAEPDGIPSRDSRLDRAAGGPVAHPCGMLPAATVLRWRCSGLVRRHTV